MTIKQLASRQPATITPQTFYLVVTGAPMDSVLCSACLANSGAFAAGKGTAEVLDETSIAAIIATEGLVGCDVCGEERR